MTSVDLADKKTTEPNRSPSKTVPGPAGFLTYPKRFLDYCRDPLAYLTRIARQYGDVVLLQSFGLRFYMFNHPDQIEEILRHKHRSFKKDFYVVSLRPLLGDGLLTSDGESWRRQRAMSQPAFQARQIQQYAATMVDYTQELLATWKPDETRDIHSEMMRLTARIVTKTLFDADVNDNQGSIGKDLEVAMDFYANPLSMWPAWRYVPTPTNLRFHRTLRRLNAIVFRLIQERRATGTEGRGDLLSRLLVAEDEEGRKMSDTELRDELMTLFLAGHETTALTLSYTFLPVGPVSGGPNRARGRTRPRAGRAASDSGRREPTALYGMGHQGIDAALSPRLDHRPRGARRLRDRRLPYQKRLAAPDGPVGRPSRPAVLDRSGPLRSRAVGRGAYEELAAVCLLPLRRRPAGLHRLRICHDGGCADPGRHRQAFPARTRPGSKAAAGPLDHHSPARRYQDDGPPPRGLRVPDFEHPRRRASATRRSVIFLRPGDAQNRDRKSHPIKCPTRGGRHGRRPDFSVCQLAKEGKHQEPAGCRCRLTANRRHWRLKVRLWRTVAPEQGRR